MRHSSHHTSSVSMHTQPCEIYWNRAKKSSVISLISAAVGCHLLKQRHSRTHGMYSPTAYRTRRRHSGNLDNNARNIVIRDEESAFFIDFASIGWNWQEMRLVQLLNSIGAFLVLPSGNANFVSLLDRELVNSYAEWVSTHRETCPPAEVTARVDGHHLLFYLSVIHQLLRATVQPEATENRMLLDAWGDAQARYQSALTHIIHTRLSDDVSTNQIREIITGFSA